MFEVIATIDTGKVNSHGDLTVIEIQNGNHVPDPRFYAQRRFIGPDGRVYPAGAMWFGSAEEAIEAGLDWEAAVEIKLKNRGQ